MFNSIEKKLASIRMLNNVKVCIHVLTCDILKVNTCFLTCSMDIARALSTRAYAIRDTQNVKNVVSNMRRYGLFLIYIVFIESLAQ